MRISVRFLRTCVCFHDTMITASVSVHGRRHPEGGGAYVPVFPIRGGPRIRGDQPDDCGAEPLGQEGEIVREQRGRGAEGTPEAPEKGIKATVAPMALT